MPSRFSGKYVLVTGGSSGIGLATARRFAAEGAQVFVTGRREKELAAAINEIGSGSAIALRADASKLADLDHVYGRIKEVAGRLDVVFANAGGGGILPLGSITEEQFDDTFGRNVKGVLFTVQKALPLLANGASVILAGSTAGSMGMPGLSVYAATKAAVRSFARTWTLELKDRAIRVNVIAPGAVQTPGLSGLVPPDAVSQKALRDTLIADIPLGRMGDPDEIASAVLFLASAEASFVAGVELFADGGTAQV
jgi:NAD(P)-dependent dehydrogenase (short-subunit alcohol dehydrogenase family)